ncbi:MAG TPA: rod shape-determining protein RodA [Acidimicrobiales bacterium]|nr:rod shape-determining protein RodA [Acidimicrobiales bacterium]
MTYAPATLGTRSRQVSARVDLLLLGATGLLALTGVVMIYSATKGKLAIAGEDPRYFLKRQAIFLVLGLVVLVAAALFDYRRLEQISTVLYVGIVLALLAVLSPVGSHAQGSQRWFSLGPLQLQPSEFATLVLIIAVATYCTRRPEGLDFRDLVRLVLMSALPILLVIKQPDLGTAIVMSVILMVMLAVAGMPGRYLLLLIAGAVLVVIVALNVGLLKHYQIVRLTSFISPHGASQNVTYNVTQAKDAIAHGGIFGRGLFRGAVTNLAYVPEQQTDFIFSAVGEQLGFVGAGVLLLLYGVVGWRVLRTAQLAKDTFGRLICSGVFALLAFSVFENVGMNMGIMPVAGIPLPFLSYGGSAMIGFMAAIGLTISVHMRSVR